MSKESLKKTESLCAWVKSHAGFPTNTSGEDKVLARWLSRRRYAVKQGFVIPSEEKEILESYGLPDIFVLSSDDSHSLDMSHTFNMWVKANGREPRSSGGPFELKLYRWNRRRKSGEYVEASVVEGISCRETLSSYLAVSLCLWVVEHGGKPSRSSSDPGEARLARWLSNKRRASHNKGKSTLYPSDVEALESYRLKHLLD